MGTIDLSGSWKVHLDPGDVGLAERWFENLDPEEGLSVVLPGSLEEEGIGGPVDGSTVWVGSQFGKEFHTEDIFEPYRNDGNFKFIYWLQPESRYIGPAWYVREIMFPEAVGESEAERWELFLERPHWETRAWLDGVCLGRFDSLCVPHRYTLTRKKSARKGILVIRVDNRMIREVGPNAHSVSDQTQGCWNGIIGKMELRSVPPCSISVVRVYHDIGRKSALVELELMNESGADVLCGLAIDSVGLKAEGCLPRQLLVRIPSGGKTVYREIVFDESAKLWDEFSPAMVSVDITLKDESSAGILDRKRVRTGLREVKAGDRSILVNGKPVFLRGVVECCVFPKTGHPPMDNASWRALFVRLKQFGLNHVRFHSWCPPQAAFDMADEEGVYLQVECPIWKNQGVRYEGDADFDDWLFRESQRIVDEYGNHPSFIMFTSGNEPDGRHEEFLGLWVNYWKKRDGRRVYTAASGWPVIEENDFNIIPQPRIQAWGAGLSSRINAHPPETMTDYTETCARYSGPVITHEMGQWCAFPDFSEINEYTGHLKPKNFEVFEDILRRRGMEKQGKDFLFASGKLQTLCYKEEIESALRTRNLGGFQLLGLTDFPGQGTALVGVLNAFWGEKGYCSAPEFREFCNDAVLLARFPKRYYSQSEEFKADMLVFNYSAGPLRDASVRFSVLDENDSVVSSGSREIEEPMAHGLISLGSLSVPLSSASTPARHTLLLELPDSGIRNRWNFWVYPPKLDIPFDGINVLKSLDESAVRLLQNGLSVLVLADPGTVLSDVEIGFSPVFWNTSWTGGQAPHTLGILCDRDHPAFRHFPTDSHADWQWWEIVRDSAAMVVDDFPTDIIPLIQPIDTWFRSHRLALLFECRIGNGKLVVSSIDFSRLGERIVARQLLSSIVAYMKSSSFKPKTKLDACSVMRLFRKTIRSGASARSSTP